MQTLPGSSWPIYDESTGLEVTSIPPDSRAHYLVWVFQYDSEDDRIGVTKCVNLALFTHPDLIERGKSWPEIRDIGDRLWRDICQ